MITGISSSDLFYRFHVDKVSSAHVYLRLHQVHVFLLLLFCFFHLMRECISYCELGRLNHHIYMNIALKHLNACKGL